VFILHHQLATENTERTEIQVGASPLCDLCGKNNTRYLHAPLKYGILTAHDCVDWIVV
jgi:hypothetical protein